MHILIVRNNSNSQAVDASLLLVTYLATQSLTYTLVDSSELSHRCDNARVNDALAAGANLVVVLGGDGTILRTARQVAAAGIPLLGINFGRLGFLANSSADGVIAVVAAALAQDVVAEQRANLRVDVVCEGEYDPWREEGDCAGGGHASESDEGQKPHHFFALNELAVTRGANGCIIDFTWSISGVHVADMRGDGLVVATATGSTAYALSAGGPLVSPGFNGLVVVPVAPHTLHSRALVTASNDVVEIDLSGNSDTREATLFIDGALLEFERPVHRIYVQRGEVPTTLLRYRGEGFYEHAAKVFF